MQLEGISIEFANARLRSWTYLKARLSLGMNALRMSSGNQSSATSPRVLGPYRPSHNPIKMSKKIVLITGANTGIGFETAKALLKSSEPYHVFVGSRDATKGEQAAAALAKDIAQTTSTFETIQIDVTSDESINQAAGIVKAKFGRLDVLVNNAGS